MRPNTALKTQLMVSYDLHRNFGATTSTLLPQCNAYNKELLEIFPLPKQHFKHQIVALKEFFQMVSNTLYCLRNNFKQFLFMRMVRLWLTLPTMRRI
jgi:hypothetical protein